MANCCGGKNAGKPISWPRYVAGVIVFFSYHGAVAIALHLLSVPFKRWRHIRDFHRQVFLSEGIEVLQRRDINVNGQLAEQVDACEASPPKARPVLSALPTAMKENVTPHARAS